MIGDGVFDEQLLPGGRSEFRKRQLIIGATRLRHPAATLAWHGAVVFARSASRSFRARAAGFGLAALTLFILAPISVDAAHPNALWRVVHDLCVTNRRLTGLSAPCLEVNLAAGYALVPDPEKAAHLLLVPTRRMPGIEDPRLLNPSSPSYWQEAWSARRTLDARVGGELPPDAVGLAINAMSGRSQGQLHIHISCIRPKVAVELRMLEPAPTERWSGHEILGRWWRIRRLLSRDLAGANPFRLVADSSSTAAAHMGQQTIIVVGARLKAGPGFYILTRSSDVAAGDQGTAEELLDERCRGFGYAAPPS